MVQETWAIDCETDPFLFDRIPKPFLWGAFNVRDHTYLEFERWQELVDYFRARKCLLYAHNGGRFDWHFLLGGLEAGIPIKVIGGRLAQFKIGAAEYRDSFSILPFSLDKYKKTKIEYWKFEEAVRQEHMPEIRSYLKDDCKNLGELIAKFHDQFGPKLTLAGAAMSYWEKEHGGDKGSSSRHFYKTFEPYYYGGRVECFRTGHGYSNFQVFDINSAYPRAMCEDHPIGTAIGQEQSLRPLTREDQCRSFITVMSPSVGAFPYRDASGALSFPSDGVERTFHVTGWEYVAAQDLGLLDARTKVLSVLTLDRTINFTPYIQEFFARKAAAKPQLTDDQIAEYIFAKLFQNSLYGRYGMNPGPGIRGGAARYKEYKTCAPEEVAANKELEGWSPVRREHGVVILVRDLPEAKWRFHNVATAASITGYVRAFLLRAIGQSNGLLYCDTDSLACERFGGTIGKGLGEWSCDGEFNEYAIAGKKLYAFFGPVGKPKIASKGCKLTANQIKAIAKGAEIVYKNEAPTFGVSGVKFVTRKIKATA